jgi:hypothetical protein
MLVAGSIALSGCGKRSATNPTMISYSQVGVCKSYGDEEKAKPNEGFVIFKIETIDNSKQSDTFYSVFGHTIRQVQRFTSKPILLSETAVGPDANRSAKIGDLFTGIAKYNVLGLVWFDYKHDRGFVSQDWHIEGNAPATAAFSLGVSSHLNLIIPK